MCSTFADANKENVYEKGKAPLLTANEEDTGEGDDAEDDDDEDDANEGDAGDMQVRNSYRLLLCASHIPKQLLLSTIASSHCAPCLWAAEVDRSENNFRLQLAWEMLEVARSIYSKMGDEKALALAGTSMPIAYAWHSMALAKPSLKGRPLAHSCHAGLMA